MKRKIFEDAGISPAFEDLPISEETVEGAEITEETRLPFGSRQARLEYADREGYHRHWFNDSPGRIQRALQAGYKFVKDHEGRNVARPVGVQDGGGAMLGYLMEVPNEWWLKDLAEVQKRVDEVDVDIRRGNVAGSVGTDGRYVPAARPIKVTHGSST